MRNQLFLFLGFLVSLGTCSYTVIPLGTKGGFDDGNLSAYALASETEPRNFVLLDAGTLVHGLIITQKKGYLKAYVPHEVLPIARPGYFLQKQIFAYLISHAHMDHIKGLIINSVEDDAVKPIFGINATLTNIKNNLFNGQIWPNFGPNGLDKYTYNYVTDGVPTQIPQTKLTLEAYHLRHAYPYLSTAYLILNDQNHYFLYFGDTGPDSVENLRSFPNDLNTNLIVWKRVAPLVRDNLLMAIFIECSYLDPIDAGSLFGHLSPKYLTEELTNLENEVLKLTTKENPLKGLNIVITHIKPVVSGDNISCDILDQLKDLNTFQVNYILPTQGVPLVFSSTA